MVLYPFVGLYVALKLAKFYFEKDIKKQYLLAKDKVATDMINQLCIMLRAMWVMVNIDSWVTKGNADPGLPQQRQEAYADFYKAINDSYPLLGLMGLYCGVKIVDDISELQSDLNEMVNANTFTAFDEWTQFRRKRLLPILDRVHKELKYTIFDRSVFDLF